ncbi:MAG: bifunctional phosphopantothenoylcysteine decarboxylase/phosphopantothenate--cysteine ligase CoaBC [Bacteroidales bacterium]|nr:bifunctional phosphopantothenoylcysteine decarboxylase/phosphopantothenate--cysteine ligase CoaBC [Bacteroidales bacterium]
MLKGKKILIGVTGSIAAYKIPILIRLLIKEGAEVKVILTDAAKDFVTPLTLSTLSGNPVQSEFFEKTDGTWNSHVDLGNWADLYLLAPVSANTMGKLANGMADNLLSATYLAAKCPVFFAPAMDVDMYNHPSTSKNINQLKTFGNILVEPEEGELASGLYGAGRMQEPEKIIKILDSFFQKKKDFDKVKVLISAGPTYEAIDPVRFIGNFSTGQMGYALANEFSKRGAIVELVSGPVNLKIDSENVNITNVTSAAEMYNACLSAFSQVNIAIMSAAVADYTPERQQKQKIKKQAGSLTIKLQKTKDILKELGNNKRKDQYLVGFALETENEFENAKAKLKNKKLDLIVLNSLQDKGAGFGYSTNKITLLDNKGDIDQFELKSKSEVAKDIADKISSTYKMKN